MQQLKSPVLISDKGGLPSFPIAAADFLLQDKVNEQQCENRKTNAAGKVYVNKSL
jgi:hypothetical protein